jgi:hypothetical protein
VCLDVKLENLLYDEHDVLRVADWGLAQFCEPGAHRRCLPVGTGTHARHARTHACTHARMHAPDSRVAPVRVRHQ